MTLSFEVEDAYNIISEFYGDMRAERSNQLLIKHIDEGLRILDVLNANDGAKAAYVVHPIIQSLSNPTAVVRVIETCTPFAIAFAFEYRNIANAYLSTRSITSLQDIVLSPIGEVQDMLIADKVQNYHDFLQFHKDTHSRSQELDQYFKNWLLKLGVRLEDFQGCFI